MPQGYDKNRDQREHEERNRQAGQRNQPDQRRVSPWLDDREEEDSSNPPAGKQGSQR